MYHKGTGKLIYDPHRPGLKKRTKWWCVINIDEGDEIVRYYRWWINQEILNPFGLPDSPLKSQSWWPHISIVRGERPPGDKIHLWKKYHGMKVEFSYDYVYNFKIGTNNKGDAPGVFFFVEVECPLLTEIRKEIGLKCSWKFHLTFGRTYTNLCINTLYEKKIDNQRVC